MGELVKKSFDAYFSGTEKQIKFYFRFFVATTGSVFFMGAMFIFGFDKWSKSWDPNIANILLENFLVVPVAFIGSVSAYLGLLVSLTKIHHSFTRLFLAGAFLPAIVLGLASLIASRL